MKRVLVTGANGFTGGNLMKILYTADVDPIPLVHRSCGLENE
ncbi:MAG: NAD(P)-dependent oxidoreductase, partial [bacterium]|nr:NAD(P)-dependent oxidoreductase [bacterium]